MKQHALYFLTTIFLFFAPMQGLMIAVAMAIIMETFFLIYRCAKDPELDFNAMDSLVDLLSKIVMYELCIICLYTMDFFFLSDITFKLFSIEFLITKACAIVFIFVEGVSIKEHFEKATGRDVWALLKGALGKAKEVKDSVKDLIEK